MWMMFPLFWWSDLYSLLLQPCWLQPPVRCSIYLHWTCFYLTLCCTFTIHSSRWTYCFQYKYVILFKHMNTYGISPTYLWPKNWTLHIPIPSVPICLNGFLRLAVATVAARECILGSFLLFNQGDVGSWPAKHGTKSSNMEMWCDLI